MGRSQDRRPMWYGESPPVKEPDADHHNQEEWQDLSNRDHRIQDAGPLDPPPGDQGIEPDDDATADKTAQRRQLVTAQHAVHGLKEERDKGDVTKDRANPIAPEGIETGIVTEPLLGVGVDSASQLRLVDR